MDFLERHAPQSELRNMNADANRLTVLIQDTSPQIQMVRTVWLHRRALYVNATVESVNTLNDFLLVTWMLAQRTTLQPPRRLTRQQ